MRSTFQFQLLLLLAPLLASSAFTISPGRTTVSTLSGRNNAQLRHQVPRILSVVNPEPMGCRRMRSNLSSCLHLAASEDESSSLESACDEKEAKADDDTAIAPVWKRIIFFNKYNKDGTPKPRDEDDGLTFKQKLAKMGLSVLLSYGFVSNMSYCVTVSLA